MKKFLPLILAVVVLVLLMPRSAKFNYDYKKGTPWPYETLIAPFDFPLLKTEAQIAEEMARLGGDVIPCYRWTDDAYASAAKAVDAVEFGKYARLKPVLLNSMRDIYGKGVLSDAKVKVSGVYGQVSEDVVMVQKGKTANNYPVSELYKVSEARSKLLADATLKCAEFPLDSILTKSGIYNLIIPNLVYDRALTELIHSETTDVVSPTEGYVRAEQKIVSKGEIVTADIARMLDSYKAEFNSLFGYNGPRILLWLGNILIALILVLILYLTVYYTNASVFEDRNRYYYLVTVFLIASLTAFLVERLYPSLMYLVPFPVSALYLRAFFKKQVVFPVYTVCLLPLLIFSASGVELFVMFLFGGAVALYAFNFFSHGWHQFIAALIVFVSLIIVYFGFRLIDTATAGNIGRTVLYLLIGSLSLVAFYPVIFLFEKIFNLVSGNRLRELGDTNNKHIRELQQKAPGTFQHSLQVASMAEDAARSIGADVLLVRAGALYHDIGKMRNPLCFIENEPPSAEYHYHDHLSPKESGRAIVRHVTDGMELARSYRLPSVVADFILTHHGTSCTRYFYNQYIEAGGDPDAAKDFFYPGKKPSSVEQVILMICDSVEAASRTLRDHSPETISQFVENIVEGKIREGQLSEGNISIRDLGTVKEALKTYLAGVYHERIEYPTEETNNQQ